MTDQTAQRWSWHWSHSFRQHSSSQLRAEEAVMPIEERADCPKQRCRSAGRTQSQLTTNQQSRTRECPKSTCLLHDGMGRDRLLRRELGRRIA